MTFEPREFPGVPKIQTRKSENPNPKVRKFKKCRIEIKNHNCFINWSQMCKSFRGRNFEDFQNFDPRESPGGSLGEPEVRSACKITVKSPHLEVL